MWNGAIAFGSVTVPVKVYAATDPRSLGMRELHASDGAPIAHRYFDPDSGNEVASEKVVRGAEVSSGRFVILSAEELKGADRPKRRAVEIEAFVPEQQIDPLYWDRAYNLAPQPAGEDGYAVLLEALTQTRRSGIGRVVLRSRERLVTVRATENTLRMHTMRFHDELVRGSSVKLKTKARHTGRPEMEMAATLIAQLSGAYEPGRFRDTYRERVEKLARSKASGKRSNMRRRAAPQETDDLLAALKASVARGT
jgi:DNA end-binding protein Ku